MKSAVAPRVVAAANDRQVLVGEMCDSCWMSVLERQWWAGAAADEFAPDWMLSRLVGIDDEEVLSALVGRGVDALPTAVTALLAARGLHPGSGGAMFVPLTEARASAPAGVSGGRRRPSAVGKVLALVGVVGLVVGGYWLTTRGWNSESSISSGSVASTSQVVSTASSSTSSTSTTDVSTTSTSVVVTTTAATTTTPAAVVVPVTTVQPAPVTPKVTTPPATSPPAPAPVVTSPPATSPPAQAPPPASSGTVMPDAAVLECTMSAPPSISWAGSNVSQIVLKLNGAPVKTVAGSSISYSPGGALGVWSVDLTVTGSYSGWFSASECF